MTLTVRFKCPSCETLYRPIEVSESATTVHRRTCRHCRERWQLVVRRIGTVQAGQLAGAALTQADFTFLGR